MAHSFGDPVRRDRWPRGRTRTCSECGYAVRETISTASMEMDHGRSSVEWRPVDVDRPDLVVPGCGDCDAYHVWKVMVS